MWFFRTCSAINRWELRKETVHDGASFCCLCEREDERGTPTPHLTPPPLLAPLAGFQLGTVNEHKLADRFLVDQRPTHTLSFSPLRLSFLSPLIRAAVTFGAALLFLRLSSLHRLGTRRLQQNKKWTWRHVLVETMGSVPALRCVGLFISR